MGAFAILLSIFSEMVFSIFLFNKAFQSAFVVQVLLLWVVLIWHEYAWVLMRFHLRFHENLLVSHGMNTRCDMYIIVGMGIYLVINSLLILIALVE